MASRDVELVIKARDQSSKIVDQVTKALNGLVDAQGDIGKSAGKVDTVFGRFAKSVGDLDKALGGMSSLSRITRAFEQASDSSARLSTNLEETRAEVGKLSADLEQAKKVAADYEKQVADTGKALDREKKTLKDAGAAHRELNSELSEAKASRSQLATAEANLTAKLEQQEAKLDVAKDRYVQLAAGMDAAEKPTKRMANALEAAVEAIDKQSAKLDATRTKLAETRTAIAAAEGSVAGLTAKVADSEAKLIAQRTALDGTKTAYRGLQDASRAAAQAQNGLAKSYERTVQQLGSAEAELTQANTALDELKVKAGQAEKAMADLAQAASGPLTQAYRAQQSIVSRINNVYQDNRKELAALSAIMGQVGVPTKEMVETYQRLNQVSKEVATEYKQQSAVLRQLGASLKETVTDSDQLAKKQREFGNALQQGSAALARVSAETAKAANGSQRLVAENNKVLKSYRDLGAAHRAGAAAAAAGAGANDKLADSYRRQANASRQAMSFTQRLRGEVLSLISAYGGIYGVIELLNQTVKAYQTLEAATSRLQANNAGDMVKTADDLDFIRRNADRLGIQFGLLADEYTKFAASTKGTVLAGKATRDVFISIAEAGRVSKLSFEDMQGIFRAVIQIASKGKVQLEELSGQLGDRLPGALQIMADGLGITVEQLTAMTGEGQVASSALVNFANELDKRYGSQLEASLKTTTTALGQLQNAAFQALVVFGEGGFIEGFTELVRDLTEVLKDPAFLDFASRISAGFGVLAKVLGTAAKNFDLVAFAVSGLIGLKLSGVLIRWGNDFLKLATDARTGAAGVTAANAAAASTAGAAAGAARGVGLLTAAFRALLSSTGIGLAITGVTLALGYWATRATDATTAMTAHQAIVDKVKNAYDKAAGSSKNWANEIKNTTRTEAEANLVRLQAQLADARREAAKAANGIFGNASIFGGNFISPAVKAQIDQIKDLTDRFKDGKLDVNAYKASLDKLAQTGVDESVRSTAAQLVIAAESTRDTEAAVKAAELVLKIYTGTAEEAQAAIKELNGDTADAEGAFDKGASGAKRFKDALDGIKGLIPELADELKALKDQMELDDYVKQLGLGPYTQEQQALIDKAQAAINAKSFEQIGKKLEGFSDGISAATALIAAKESFSAVPYNDGKRDRNGKMISTVYRAGYGSDEITLADGTIQKVTAGMRVSVEDATRDLNRRVQEFAGKVVDKIGKEQFAAFNPQQQAVLTSIAYNYGELPDRIAKVIKEGGSTEQIAAAIKALGTDNGGINAKRRNEEAFIFGNGAYDEKAAEKALEDGQKRLEQAKEFHETQKASNEQAAFELTLMDQNKVKAEQAKAIREAELAAKKAGTELTQKERDEILKNVEAKYREEAAQDEINKKKKAAEDAEQKVNDLIARRTELQEQMKLYTESGDTAKAAEAKEQIAGINTELQAAIANATAMWQAVGGTGADAAVAKLQTAKLETDKLSQGAKQNLIDWTRVGELFASGLTNAFDRFAQAVANGEDIGEAARNAFLQFAADFLIEIGKMIIQQAILNALRSFGGPFANIGAGHTGGVVGSSRIGGGNRTRSLPAGIFASAPRFHDGASVGLKPNEVPAVLKKNEEVLNENDPRNVLNGGLGKAAAQAAPAPAGGGGIKIVNTFDSADVVSHALSTAPGETAFINSVKSNARVIKDILDNA